MNTARHQPRLARGLFSPYLGWIGRTPTKARALLAIATSVVYLSVLLGAARQATAAPSASLRIDPPSVSTDAGQTFIVNIVQNAGVATLGWQTNLVFDTKLLQIKGMTPGPAYAKGAFAYGSSIDGSNKSVAAAIAKANATGALRNVAAFLLPGSGSVPAGDAVALMVTMEARTGASGTAKLDLKPLPTSPIQMLDESANVMAVATTSGSVTIKSSPAASGAVSPSPVPSGAASSPSASASSSGVAGPPSPVPSAVEASPLALPSEDTTGAPASGAVLGGTSATAALSVAPASSRIDVGATSTFDFKYRIDASASSISADLAFDKAVLQIVKIEPGPAWSQATVLAGGAGLTLDQAIGQANSTGQLDQVGVLLPHGSSSLPTGEGTFVTVTFKGAADGTTTVTMSRATVLDADGAPMSVSLADAQLVVGTGGAVGVTTLLVLGVVVVAVIAGVVLLARARRRSRQ